MLRRPNARNNFTTVLKHTLQLVMMHGKDVQLNITKYLVLSWNSTYRVESTGMAYIQNYFCGPEQEEGRQIVITAMIYVMHSTTYIYQIGGSENEGFHTK